MTYLTANNWFSEEEFRCKCGCGLFLLHPGFIQKLDWVRYDLNEQMIVTSGCRCKRYNAQVGGHPKSLHICDAPQYSNQEGTAAVDIRAPNGQYRGRLFSVAWQYGFSVGWNAKHRFLHLDRRDFFGLPQTSFDY